MKEVLVTVEVDILVSVDDDVSLADATKIALFNVDSISGGINTKLNEKMQDIEIVDYNVSKAEWEL